ncbi:hypothetical protein AR9_g122 [Bacillus phage AR9]|uniref:Uncharacterized protein n=1 Tax=Bacillus phage AR9 TaxID=1815509 RepID=A0A172JI29_BPPB1|nr:hypothetical protein BI022_gp121 [Bacillus phage AR9]AMS01206.1 hypothetical protein AR9_g122 [Bacillus phage AR9]
MKVQRLSKPTYQIVVITLDMGKGVEYDSSDWSWKWKASQ